MTTFRASTALGDLAGKIAQTTGSPPPGGYRKLLQMATDATLPGARRVNGKWYVDDDAFPEVLATLGTTIKSQRKRAA